MRERDEGGGDGRTIVVSKAMLVVMVVAQPAETVTCYWRRNTAQEGHCGLRKREYDKNTSDLKILTTGFC